MLQVRDLRVKYGDVTALHGIDLEVEPREVVALLGCNGARKITVESCSAAGTRYLRITHGCAKRNSAPDHSIPNRRARSGKVD